MGLGGVINNGGWAKPSSSGGPQNQQFCTKQSAVARPIKWRFDAIGLSSTARLHTWPLLSLSASVCGGADIELG